MASAPVLPLPLFRRRLPNQSDQSPPYSTPCRGPVLQTLFHHPDSPNDAPPPVGPALAPTAPRNLRLTTSLAPLGEPVFWLDSLPPSLLRDAMNRVLPAHLSLPGGVVVLCPSLPVPRIDNPIVPLPALLQTASASVGSYPHSRRDCGPNISSSASDQFCYTTTMPSVAF